jgi:hypothetical protein
MTTKIPQNSPKYNCEKCGIKTSNKKDYNNHLLTRKHINTTNYNNLGITVEKEHICDCGKKYNHRSSLFNHKKKCINNNNNNNNNLSENTNTTIPTTIPDINFFTNIVLEVVKNNTELQKQNQDLQKQMLELYKTTNTSITNNNNNNNNSYNKTFNLQFFLNEQCKDAMNIMDFVNSMTLEFADLEAVGKLGYVEGISGIIIKKLNEMDIYKRPIHCSDAKREIMFVKDDNVWEKENSTYDKLRKAIKYVTKKNSDMLIPWSKKYPACMNTSHPLNDTYIKLMGQAMGGKEEFVDSENKIMKKIAKAVLIDKNC